MENKQMAKVSFLKLMQQNMLVAGTLAKPSLISACTQPYINKVIESIIEIEYRESLRKNAIMSVTS